MNIVCFVCKTRFDDYRKLSQHILDSKDSKHRTKAQLEWASRFINGLPKKDTYSVMDRSIKRIRHTDIHGEDICSLCHKPIGVQDQKHCNC